jgi:hypothetical protein
MQKLKKVFVVTVGLNMLDCLVTVVEKGLSETNTLAYSAHYLATRKRLVFVPGRLFQRSLMFVGKARSLPLSRAHQMCFTSLS